jgi:hypothetical protein
LIVAHHRVAVVARLALSTKACKDCSGDHWPIQNPSRFPEAFSLLGENGHAGVYDLHDVIWANREGVVRGIADIGLSLRTGKAKSQTVKTFDQLGGGASAL